MRYIFWNVRGLGTTHRRGLVLKHIVQKNLDFVGIQETIKQEFSDHELKEMAGSVDFVWKWIPAKGHSGGLLVGVKVESLEIEQVELADFFLGCLVRNRITNFRFWILNVYGPAHHDLSGEFILDLSNFCSREILPMVLRGDFNLIRSNKDRNQGQGDPKLMELFNNFIGSFQLRDIFVSGVKYTWSNRQKIPTMEKLDRILVTSNWDLNYSKSFACSKARIGSDHSPLILDSGKKGDPRSNYFFFEEKWIHQEGFFDLLGKKWREFKNEPGKSNYSLSVWHGCLQALRHYLREWSLRIAGENKEIKKSITTRIEEIDIIAEKRLLSNIEWEERINLEETIDKMNLVEEL